MTLYDPEGRQIKSVKEQRPEDAAICDKILGIYFRHNLGKTCECNGCEQIRILLLHSIEVPQ